MRIGHPTNDDAQPPAYRQWAGKGTREGREWRGGPGAGGGPTLTQQRVLATLALVRPVCDAMRWHDVTGEISMFPLPIPSEFRHLRVESLVAMAKRASCRSAARMDRESIVSWQRKGKEIRGRIFSGVNRPIGSTAHCPAATARPPRPPPLRSPRPAVRRAAI